MSFRFLIVDTSGDVTGTNDNCPDVSESDTIVCIIDTADGSYCNDDEDDAVIEQHGERSDDNTDDE